MTTNDSDKAYLKEQFDAVIEQALALGFSEAEIERIFQEAMQ